MPISVSSTLPRKIMSFMLATEAMVVPSLKLLLWITELPTLIGTLRIMPVMVLRICVVLELRVLREMPSRTISSALWALASSSLALR